MRCVLLLLVGLFVGLVVCLLFCLFVEIVGLFVEIVGLFVGLFVVLCLSALRASVNLTAGLVVVVCLLVFDFRRVVVLAVE